MDLASSTAKLGCYFSESVYSNYYNSRYGINSCEKKHSFYDLLALHMTRDLLEHYSENECMYEVDQLTTNLSGLVADPNRVTVEGPCDLSKLIEKIQTL